MNFVYILLFLYQLFWWRWSIYWCGVVKVELWRHYIIVVVVRKTLWWYCICGSKFLSRFVMLTTQHMIAATVTILIQQPLDLIYLNHLTLLLPFHLFVLPKRTLLLLHYRTNISALLIVLILFLTLYCRNEGIVSM